MNLNAMENDILSDDMNGDVKQVNKEIRDDSGCLHAFRSFFLLTNQKEEKSHNGYILLLHGVCSSALHFLTALKGLEGEEIHALELPGFGRSQMETMHPEMEGIEVIESVCKHIEVYLGIRNENENQNESEIDQKKKRDITIIGHSLGAFFAVHFAKRNPEMVERLILVDPIGILSDLSPLAERLTILFKVYFTRSQLLFCKWMGMENILHALTSKEKQVVYHYYLRLLFSEDAFGHFFLKRFFDVRLTGCRWNMPCLEDLCDFASRKSKSVHLMYGGEDTLTPHAQGSLILGEIEEKNKNKNKNKNKERGVSLSLDIIPGGGHTPIVDKTEYFCEIVKRRSRKECNLSMSIV